MEKLWYYGQNYGTMEKGMELWKKLWYYTENYGTLILNGKKTRVELKNYGTIVNYRLL